MPRFAQEGQSEQVSLVSRWQGEVMLQLRADVVVLDEGILLLLFVDKLREDDVGDESVLGKVDQVGVPRGILDSVRVAFFDK